MPIDVSYPIPLLEDIFSDSEPVAVFTEPSLTQFLPGLSLLVALSSLSEVS